MKNKDKESFTKHLSSNINTYFLSLHQSSHHSTHHVHIFGLVSYTGCLLWLLYAEKLAKTLLIWHPWTIFRKQILSSLKSWWWECVLRFLLWNVLAEISVTFSISARFTDFTSFLLALMRSMESLITRKKIWTSFDIEKLICIYLSVVYRYEV